MIVLKKSVLLLKSEKSDSVQDKYQTLLEANNFKVTIIKSLVFSFKNLEMLKEKLLKPAEFSGIILSSPRCVSAVSQSLDKNEIKKLWTEKLNFSVGEATHQEALDKLGLECRGKESGNSRILSDVIALNASNVLKPFLFPHGNLKTDTLKLELGKVNIKLEEVLVYETLANPSLEEEIASCTSNYTCLPEFIVFFSPSGFNSSIEYLKKASDFNSAKIIAIGPVTKLAIEEKNLRVHNTAQRPTPEEVLRALL